MLIYTAIALDPLDPQPHSLAILRNQDDRSGSFRPFLRLFPDVSHHFDAHTKAGDIQLHIFQANVKIRALSGRRNITRKWTTR